MVLYITILLPWISYILARMHKKFFYALVHKKWRFFSAQNWDGKKFLWCLTYDKDFIFKFFCFLELNSWRYDHGKCWKNDVSASVIWYLIRMQRYEISFLRFGSAMIFSSKMGYHPILDARFAPFSPNSPRKKVMPDFSGFFWSLVPENLVNIIAYRDIKFFIQSDAEKQIKKGDFGC